MLSAAEGWGGSYENGQNFGSNNQDQSTWGNSSTYKTNINDSSRYAPTKKIDSENYNSYSPDSNGTYDYSSGTSSDDCRSRGCK